MSKLLKNVIVGIASGAAVAYFLTSEKGKELQQKAKKAYDAYKEDPTKYNQKAKDKATEYTDLAVDTFNDYKQKLESGELTTEDILGAVKEKGQAVAEYTGEKVSEVASKVSKAVEETEAAHHDKTGAEVDDIIINYAPKSQEDTDAETSSDDESVKVKVDPEEEAKADSSAEADEDKAN